KYEKLPARQAPAAKVRKQLEPSFSWFPELIPQPLAPPKDSKDASAPSFHDPDELSLPYRFTGNTIIDEIARDHDPVAVPRHPAHLSGSLRSGYLRMSRKTRLQPASTQVC